jgi:hypothetical protein
MSLGDKACSGNVVEPDASTDKEMPPLMRMTKVIKLAWPDTFRELVTVDNDAKAIA